MTMAKVVGGISLLAALAQSISVYRYVTNNGDLILHVRKLAKSWAWVAGSIAVLCLAIVPLLDLAGWVLGLLMIVAVIPIATFTMAIAVPIPWGVAALVTGLLHASGQCGMWLAGAQLAEGDRISFTDVSIWNTVAVSIAAYFRWHGMPAPNPQVQRTPENGRR